MVSPIQDTLPYVFEHGKTFSNEEVHVVITVKSLSGEPFPGLRVEVWQDVNLLGTGYTGEGGKANIVANYGKVTVKVIA